MNIRITILLFTLIAFQIKAQYSSIYTFSVPADGSQPYGNLFYDQGYLYGATQSGGSANKGTIYKVKTDGTGYETLLNFDDSTGYWPCGALISDGNFLYGTTSYGGFGNGTIFKIRKDGTGFLRIFCFGFSNMGRPLGSIVYDGTFFYGTTGYGGVNGNGTFYKIKPDGTGFATLHDFNNSDGNIPCGTPVLDNNYLYTMTGYGGVNDDGVICRIKTDGTGFIKLLDFNFTNGQWPGGSLIIDNGVLYGMAMNGGSASNNGLIFKININGTGYVKLLSFDGTNGSKPASSLCAVGSYLYGMTPNVTPGYGVVFKIKNDGSDFSKLYTFTAGIDGGHPGGYLVYDGTALYSTVESGWYGGTIFKIESLVGIEEHSRISEILIYPNPTHSILSITSKTEYDAVKIINLMGQPILRLEDKPDKISVSDLENGIYFVQLLDKNHRILKTEKFIKE